MASSTIDLRIAAAASRKPRARIFVRIAIVAAAAAIAAALALLPDPARAAGTPVVIKMADAQPFYTPAKVAIKVGDTVQWVNGGQTVHSVSTSAVNAQNPKTRRCRRVQRRLTRALSRRAATSATHLPCQARITTFAFRMRRRVWSE